MSLALPRWFSNTGMWENKLERATDRNMALIEASEATRLAAWMFLNEPSTHNRQRLLRALDDLDVAIVKAKH